jgi:hypothetical protein
MQFLLIASVILNIGLAFYSGTLLGILSEINENEKELEEILKKYEK